MGIICNLSFWKDILVIVASIATVIAVIFAIRGINIWKKQLKAKRKLDISEDALALFYEVKDIFKYIRNPFIVSGQINESEQRDIVKKQIKSAYITFKRYNIQREFFQKLVKTKYRYRVYFGKENLKPFNEIEKIIDDLLRASDMLGYFISLDHKDYRTKEDKFDDYIKQKELRKITMEYDEYDKINKRIDESIEEVEKFCLKIIKELPE